jgi:hypothetical protein
MASEPSPVKDVGNLTSARYPQLNALRLRHHSGHERTMSLKVSDLDRHFDDGGNFGTSRLWRDHQKPSTEFRVVVPIGPRTVIHRGPLPTRTSVYNR